MGGNIYRDRATYSQMRLEELRSRLAELPELTSFPSLTIFGVGSYARLEASKYSDLDVFFLCAGDRDDIEKPHTKELRLFGRVIDVVEKMGFPEFSNDCEYLRVLHTNEIVSDLGGRRDDYENHFTARMLLLLESQCLYGRQTYEDVTRQIVNSYFKDFPDHKQTFQPIFLLNDVCRFWKTLLLNYENKRSFGTGREEEERKTKQKVRNFKLKYSRMTTCFATIAALGSHRAPVTEGQVMELTKLTPRARLESVSVRFPEVTEVKDAVEEVLDGYAWFLEMTGLATGELEGHFSDKEKRTTMFHKANEYGDSMFKLLLAIDGADERLRLLRYLVI